MGRTRFERNGSQPAKGEGRALKAAPMATDVTGAAGAGDTVPLLRPQPTTDEMRTSLRNRVATLLRRNGASSVPPALVPLDSADPWDEFRRELDRSRRYERTFVVVRVQSRSGQGSNQDGHSATRDSMYEEMLQIGAFLRSVDRAWLADESVYVLLPESDLAMGEAFLTRVRRLAPEVLPDEGVRLSAFPLDGSTSGALLAKLRGQPLTGTPRDVATARATHLREIDLRPQRTGETT